MLARGLHLQRLLKRDLQKLGTIQVIPFAGKNGVLLFAVDKIMIFVPRGNTASDGLFWF